MKIIFLDIDGVLNSDNYFRSVNRSKKNWSRFDPVVVALVKKLAEEFSLRIVITSTWRFGAVKQLATELKMSGLIKFLHKHWKTPQLYPPNRGREIKAWLDEHSACEYLILDDDGGMLESQKKRFLQTDIFRGFTEEHYIQARKIFSNT